MATTSIELKRHYSELSDKETNEVIEAVADLIVHFLKGCNISVTGDYGREGVANEKEA